MGYVIICDISQRWYIWYKDTRRPALTITGEMYYFIENIKTALCDDRWLFNRYLALLDVECNQPTARFFELPGRQLFTAPVPGYVGAFN